MSQNIIDRLKLLIVEVKSVEDYLEFEDWQATAINSVLNMFPNNKNVPRSIWEIEAFTEYEDSEDGEGEDNTDLAIKSAVTILKGLIKDVESGFIKNEPPKIKTAPFEIHNNVNQNLQHYTQIDIDFRVKQAVNFKLQFIMDSIRHELTGKQFAELKDIQESNEEPEIKKKRFTEKLKSFGLDVVAGILSGILSNPDFFHQ